MQLGRMVNIIIIQRSENSTFCFELGIFNNTDWIRPTACQKPSFICIVTMLAHFVLDLYLIGT